MITYRILVVDDSRVVHEQMKKMLEGSEFEIADFCRSGEEALKSYEELRPDLVTMDIIMPGIDGLETCRKLKNEWPDANIFMVSSMAYDDMIDDAVEAGAKGFLFKPFTQESLLEGLRGALQAVGLVEKSDNQE